MFQIDIFRLSHLRCVNNTPLFSERGLWIKVNFSAYMHTQYAVLNLVLNSADLDNEDSYLHNLLTVAVKKSGKL
jgi:hypothetical protein